MSWRALIPRKSGCTRYITTQITRTPVKTNSSLVIFHMYPWWPPRNPNSWSPWTFSSSLADPGHIDRRNLPNPSVQKIVLGINFIQIRCKSVWSCLCKLLRRNANDWTTKKLRRCGRLFALSFSYDSFLLFVSTFELWLSSSPREGK